MGYTNVINQANITVSKLCEYDSNIGYETDFSEDGNVDGWTYYNGIHTYGCWNNYIFGTLYGDSAVLGRQTVFRYVPAEDYYTIRLVLKLETVERAPGQIEPQYGKIMWRTVSDATWTEGKSFTFDLYQDTDWHVYTINMALAQLWQGDINDLRIYPILSDGRDGDQFYIRAIQILSPSEKICTNQTCDYFPNYEPDCPGAGSSVICTSDRLDYVLSEGSVFETVEEQKYEIIKDYNDVLFVNINDYGYEEITLAARGGLTGGELARIINRSISRVDVGGYAESIVEYSEYGEFIIYSGTTTDDSTIVLQYSKLAEQLKFFDSNQNMTYTITQGNTPASGFKPLCSYKIRTYQLMDLFDDKESTEFYFDPFMYNVEGGRRDWLSAGFGSPAVSEHANESDKSGQKSRSYSSIYNANKTLIDFNHPFNASGRITKVYAGVTLDDGDMSDRGSYDSYRKATQLSGAKIVFFRPRRDGTFTVLSDKELVIPDRDYSGDALYSASQEFTEIDCDIWVNKGDLMGVYNAHLYRGQTPTGSEVDGLYLQIDGEAEGTINPSVPKGEGSAGLLFYARSNDQQRRLIVDVDLNQRYNITDVVIKGTASPGGLEYNVARCLDIDWEVDMHDGSHSSGYIVTYRPLVKAYFCHPNIYYGKECLTDGIKIVPEGRAADSVTVDKNLSTGAYDPRPGHLANGGAGVIPHDPYYFQSNGDLEWLVNYLHIRSLFVNDPFSMKDFVYDPISFTIIFPHGKPKNIYRYKIYFKEQYNFRSFALSTYQGSLYSKGNADDPKYNLIDTDLFVAVTLDGIRYEKGTSLWDSLETYLGQNPCVGHKITERVGEVEVSYPYGDLSYWDQQGGRSYWENRTILNIDDNLIAQNFDWTVLEHEFGPVNELGFRLYCDYHESVKITEMELFCIAENVGASLGGSVFVTYSPYNEHSWYSDVSEQEDGSLSAFIGDTPRYLTIEVEPIVALTLNDIVLNLDSSSVYMGDKGCEYLVLPTESKTGEENAAEVIKFKNTFGRSYDLYVDIADDLDKDSGLIFHSTMEDAQSIYNPQSGPDAYYMKGADYSIRNYEHNVAINCPVYALKNLIDGAPAYYTHDNGFSWSYDKQLVGTDSINFSNLPDGSITTLYVPDTVRSKYWKLGMVCEETEINIREMLVYSGDELLDVNFYHDKGQGHEIGAISDPAPHLKNGSVTGSYYVFTENQYIGIELDSVRSIDKIVFYHDYKDKFENTVDIAGIDFATTFYTDGGGSKYSFDIEDGSYYEHAVSIEDGDVYYDKGTVSGSYAFEEDFADCIDETITFSGIDGDPPDPDMWSNPVNATIQGGLLYITNSGIAGSVRTKAAYKEDFSVSIYYELDEVQGPVYPTMSGTGMTSSSDDGTHIASNLANMTTVSGSYWETDTMETFPHWCTYDFGTGTRPECYRICSGTTEIDKMPNSWILKGSFDNTYWYNIDTRTAEPAWHEEEMRTYSITNVTPYRYYRVHVNTGYDPVILRMFSLSFGFNAELDREGWETFMRTTTSGGHWVKLSQQYHSDYGHIFQATENGNSGTNILSTTTIPGVFSDNLCVGGTATENLTIRNSNSSYWVDKAFDGSDTSYWATANKSEPGWVIYDFGVGVKHVITRVSIKPYSTRWKDFSVFGSNNGVDFTILYSGTHAENSEKEFYVFSNLTAYRYIKITVHTGWSSTNFVVYEIGMYSAGGVYFSLSRGGEDTACTVAYNDITEALGTSQALGYDDFFIELGQDRGLFVPPEVGAYFDDFLLQTMTDEWITTSAKGSSFTCASGTYYFSLANANSSSDGGFHYVDLHPNQNTPLNEEWSFELNFKINITEQMLADYWQDTGIAVGIVWKHYTASSNPYFKWNGAYNFIGAQMTFRCETSNVQPTFGIFIRSAQDEVEEVTTGRDMEYGKVYYCTFKGDGNGGYTAEAWEDDWEGFIKICDLSTNTSIPWAADRVGVGSGRGGGYYGSSITGYTEGWISDIDFQCQFRNEHTIINETSIRLDGGYLQIAKESNPQCNVLNDSFGFDARRYCIDFYVRFNSLPQEGSPAVFAKCWEPGVEIGTGSKLGSSWAFQLAKIQNEFYFEFYVVEGGSCGRYLNENPTEIDINKWYFISLIRAPYDSDVLGVIGILVDGHQSEYDVYSYTNPVNRIKTYPDVTENDLIIGENLDGWMDVVRVSTDNDSGGSRVDKIESRNILTRPNPTLPYKYYYTFSLYNSADNYLYGKFSDVDAVFNNSYSYFHDGSIWSSTYYSYYAIDLGRRYNLSLIRTYPIESAHPFSMDNGVIFCNKDYNTPEEAFAVTNYEAKPSTGFEGINGGIPIDWTLIRSEGTGGYIINDTFYQESGDLPTETVGELRADFSIRGSFDIWIDFELGDVQEANSWYIALQVSDILTSKNAIQNRREYSAGAHFFSFTQKDDESDWTSVRTLSTSSTAGKLRIIRYDQSFSTKIVDGFTGGWVDNGYYQMINDMGDEVNISLIAYAVGDPFKPTVKTFWDNFEFSRGTAVWGSSNDARWLRIKLLNGDAVTRTIRYTGVYSDLGVAHGPGGGFNNEWISLGNSATDYYRGDNIALGTTISGSGQTGAMVYANMVDGLVSDKLEDTWGSYEGTPQYFTIDLGKAYDLYRIKIYHGYNDIDVGHLITDYTLQVSTDGNNFTTIFDIANNDLFERTHDLFEAVSARYVKMNITDYTTREEYINVDGDYVFWAGAVMRQIEIYENASFQTISSEDHPIICVNLQDKFYMNGHDLISMWSETQDMGITDTQNWHNIDANFCYSNSALNDPRKIVFNDWGDEGGYAQWVAIKRNTATHYPVMPVGGKQYYDTEDFLKYIVINSVYPPNPIEYPWWWHSNFSNLNYDYDYIQSGECIRALKIEYTGTTEPEVISFLEGDHFGQDEYASWRDGIAFYLHIDDIDKLDLTYGSFNFGGYDQTTAINPVMYSWNMTTISGILNNGWNYLSLRFKSADNIEYTPSVNIELPDTRIVHRLTLGSFNFKFRGIGEPFTMYLDGLRVERNHFKDGSRFDYGLYLHNQDYLTCPLGNVSFSACTIEMYIRPDWYWDGADYYGEFFNRALFHFANVNNDVLGASISAEGFEVYYGNILNGFESFIIPDIAFAAIDTPFHFAIVVSNDGTGTIDNSTIQVYINNNIIAKGYGTWSMGDSKHFKFILGGQSLLSQKAHSLDIKSSSVDAVVSNFKIYNYCKNDFINSMTTVDLDEGTVLEGSANFIELSADNLTYYNIDSEELPLIFRDVPANDVIEVFVRTVIPKGLTGAERRTSGVMGSWDVGV